MYGIERETTATESDETSAGQLASIHAPATPSEAESFDSDTPLSAMAAGGQSGPSTSQVTSTSVRPGPSVGETVKGELEFEAPFPVGGHIRAIRTGDDTATPPLAELTALQVVSSRVWHHRPVDQLPPLNQHLTYAQLQSRLDELLAAEAEPKGVDFTTSPTFSDIPTGLSTDTTPQSLTNVQIMLDAATRELVKTSVSTSVATPAATTATATIVGSADTEPSIDVLHRYRPHSPLEPILDVQPITVTTAEATQLVVIDPYREAEDSDEESTRAADAELADILRTAPTASQESHFPDSRSPSPVATRTRTTRQSAVVTPVTTAESQPKSESPLPEGIEMELTIAGGDVVTTRTATSTVSGPTVTVTTSTFTRCPVSRSCSERGSTCSLTTTSGWRATGWWKWRRAPTSTATCRWCLHAAPTHFQPA